jgi:membrane-bound serine protease (ClpP class)
MGFIIATILALVFLDTPWNWVVIGFAAAWEGFEIMLWLKYRKRRSITGAEAIVGTHGRALTDCRPDGQVRVKGQIWNAHCARGARAGDDVVVESIDGIHLVVAPH